MDQQLDPVFKDNEVVTLHHKHIMTVLDIILFLAQQELAFRGDDEATHSLNRDNFLEIPSYSNMTQLSKKGLINCLTTQS